MALIKNIVNYKIGINVIAIRDYMKYYDFFLKNVTLASG